MVLRRAGLSASAGLSCCYCVNKGWSSKRLNDNVQVANTENPSPMSQLVANLVLKFPSCCYHSYKG